MPFANVLPEVTRIQTIGSATTRATAEALSAHDTRAARTVGYLATMRNALARELVAHEDAYVHPAERQRANTPPAGIPARQDELELGSTGHALVELALRRFPPCQ
jgi:hypothetical protein